MGGAHHAALDRQMESVLAGISAARCIPIEDIVSTKRMETIVRARHEGMWIAKTFLGATLRQIGAVFGGRDHAAVRHGVRKVKARVAVDEAYARDLKSLCETVGATVERPPFEAVLIVPKVELDALREELDVQAQDADALRQTVGKLEDRHAMDLASICRLERALKKLRERETKASAPCAVVPRPDLAPVISAFDQLQQVRWTGRERFAFDHLLTCLSYLKAEMNSAKGASS